VSGIDRPDVHEGEDDIVLEDGAGLARIRDDLTDEAFVHEYLRSP
jgi:hypothetical protein